MIACCGRIDTQARPEAGNRREDRSRTAPERARTRMLDRKKKAALFEKTALPHLDAVYRFALHLSGHEGDAQDLTQECFHQAFRKFHQFEQGTNCKAWLFRILRNGYIDRVRQRARQPKISELNESIAGLPAADPLESLERWKHLTGEDESALQDLFGDEVARGLRELSPEFRAAVLLCDVEGLSYGEIATVLGCPVGTVRSRISRARSFLKERLEGYAKDYGLAAKSGDE